MTEQDQTPIPSNGGEPFVLSSVKIGAMPIIDRFLARLDLQATLTRYLPEGDARVRLDTSRVIGVLVRNLCVEREPLYGLAQWAEGYDSSLLSLEPGEAELLNDDRVGRALDQLFDADRASMLCDLVLHAVTEFQIDCSQLHNDSTSITLHGDYHAADARTRGGKTTVKAARGHSKDHRGDLKQLVLILTVSADGAVPIAHRLADGNTCDDQTHIDTWDGLRNLTGRDDFLYVADSKLCTREQMRHINANGGRFVTVLPRTRSEDARLREWMTRHTPDWTIAERKPGKRRDAPDDVYKTTTPPMLTAEGYRIVWVHSSSKHRRDETTRADRIDRAQAALTDLNDRMASPRARITTRVAAEEAAISILTSMRAERHLTIVITERTEESYRQEKRGRPSADTRYRKTTRLRFAIEMTLNETAISQDAASDGCFPLVTNDRDLTDPQILGAYRYQPNLEKRHHELKSVQDAAPVTLKSPVRIEALFACQFIALLCRCLIERDVRNAMKSNDIPDLPLYPEDRSCTAPTAARIFDTFNDTRRHQLSRNDQPVQTFQPQLTTLQQQLLPLLGMPEHAYTATTKPPSSPGGR